MSRKAKAIEIGSRIGLLVVLSEGKRHITKTGKSLRTVDCICDCGNKTNVILYNLTSKQFTESCGCITVKRSQIENKKHGLKNHKLYRKLYGMKTRCYNPKSDSYERYGGRGIQVCEEWRNDFVAFYNWAIDNGWEEGLEIDRIDNDGNYEPSNCRFVTPLENNHNRSTSKLTDSDALDICNSKLLIPNITNKELAVAYKIHPSTVSQILNKEIWSHI